MKSRSVITNRRLVPTMVTMSTEGQITLPIVFRRCYGIRPGTKIAIEVKDDAIIFTPYRSKEAGIA
jgi:bifunctional DNA-binding transcriptional regulator/antitoxin component of YhaV-PrlF toxin-antitoxin module